MNSSGLSAEEFELLKDQCLPPVIIIKLQEQMR